MLVLPIAPIILLTIFNSIVLSTGGDDVTEMLYVLLQQTCFPYKELDLAKLYHWQLFEDLKHSQCTMAPVRKFSMKVIRTHCGSECCQFPDTRYHYSHARIAHPCVQSENV